MGRATAELGRVWSRPVKHRVSVLNVEVMGKSRSGCVSGFWREVSPDRAMMEYATTPCDLIALSALMRLVPTQVPWE